MDDTSKLMNQLSAASQEAGASTAADDFYQATQQAKQQLQAHKNEIMSKATEWVGGPLAAGGTPALKAVVKGGIKLAKGDFSDFGQQAKSAVSSIGERSFPSQAPRPFGETEIENPSFDPNADEATANQGMVDAFAAKANPVPGTPSETYAKGLNDASTDSSPRIAQTTGDDAGGAADVVTDQADQGAKAAVDIADQGAKTAATEAGSAAAELGGDEAIGSAFGPIGSAIAGVVGVGSLIYGLIEGHRHEDKTHTFNPNAAPTANVSTQFGS